MPEFQQKILVSFPFPSQQRHFAVTASKNMLKTTNSHSHKTIFIKKILKNYGLQWTFILPPQSLWWDVNIFLSVSVYLHIVIGYISSS